MNLTKKILLPLAAIAALVLPASAMAAPKAKVQLTAPAYGVAENLGPAQITVVRPRAGHSSVRVNQAMTVDYSTADGTATSPRDYTATSSTLSFPACGSNPAADDPCLTQTVNVPVHDNFVVDGTRTFTFTLSNARTATRRAILGYPSSATVAIADNEASGAGSGSTFEFVTPVGYASEAAGSATAFVVRSGDLSQGAAISYSTSDGAAKGGTDYRSASGTLNFPDQSADVGGNSIIQAVQVQLLHNPLADPELNDFSVNLSVPGGSSSTVGSPASEQLWIVNSDGQATVLWANAGYNTSEALGTVRLLAIGAGSITGNDEVDADYATADGSAKAGVNYTAQSDTFQFFAGDFAETADIAILDDGKAGNTAFTTGLSNPVTNNTTVGAAIGNPATTTINIADSGNRSSAGNGTSGTSVDGGTTGPAGQLVLGARQGACGLTVKAAKKQRLLKQKGLKLTLRSGQSCKVTVTALIKKATARKKGAKSARALRFSAKKTSLTLQPNKSKAVKVAFTKKTLKAIQKALRARKQLVATVTVTTRDSASKLTRKTLKITIKR